MPEHPQKQATVAGFKAAALGGSHELFNLAGGEVFPVVCHFVQFSGFLTGRKPAPILNRIFAIWTIDAQLCAGS